MIALLRLVGDRRGDLGVDDHALGDRRACRRPAAWGSPRPLPASGTSTRHWRQAPTGASSGWSQNRGIWTPTCSAARITRVSLGTLTSTPSMVSVTRSVFSTLGRLGPGVVVMRWLPRARRAVEAAGSNGQPPCVEVREVLVAEVLDRAT